jgi:EAL domain-containing protein (putative c-di-GMP-specific phosphodiesterase class I)
VIDTALTQMECWREAGLDLPVSVNVSARQLQHADFSPHLRALLAAHPRIKAASLELEILESSALEDLARVSRIIKACGQIGVRFALDDFGTGYSSLTYLKRLPVAVLKIDQSFVRDMLDDPDDLAILEGVIGLARAFRRQVIAEGVETVEHGEMLLQLGCELAQGYGIARPMPAEDLPAWSATWRPDPAWTNLSSVSRDDLPLLFAMIEHRAWIRAIENYLKGISETLPLDHQNCRFGAWLETDGPAHHGMRSAFDDLEPVHRQLHELAEALLELQAAGSNSEALLRLAELHGRTPSFPALELNFQNRQRRPRREATTRHNAGKVKLALSPPRGDSPSARCPPYMDERSSTMASPKPVPGTLSSARMPRRAWRHVDRRQSPGHRHQWSRGRCPARERLT